MLHASKRLAVISLILTSITLLALFAATSQSTMSIGSAASQPYASGQTVPMPVPGFRIYPHLAKPVAVPTTVSFANTGKGALTVNNVAPAPMTRERAQANTGPGQATSAQLRRWSAKATLPVTFHPQQDMHGLSKDWHVSSVHTDATAPIVTVNTTSTVSDGNTSSVAALIANPGFDGNISLPEALTAINNDAAANPGTAYNVIFSLAHNAVIKLDQPYMLTASNVTIDGDTNNDSKPDIVVLPPNKNVFWLDVQANHVVIQSLATQGIALDTSAANNDSIIASYIGTDADGLVATNASDDGIVIQNGAYNNIIAQNTIAGNADIGNIFGIGIYIFGGAQNNYVQGNIVGLNVNGQQLANSYGVVIGSMNDSAPDMGNVIGGTDRRDAACNASCNVVSGNNVDGIDIIGAQAYNNTVEGNYIGVDTTGELAIGNGFEGVYIANAPSNTIGGISTPNGPCTGACNVISGNKDNGIAVLAGSSTSDTISGNNIGTDATGTKAIGNTQNGVLVSSAQSLSGAPIAVTIGGNLPGQGNVISGNGAYGIQIAFGAQKTQVLGNMIGSDTSGSMITDALGDSLGNGEAGVAIFDSPNNLIGGLSSGVGNVIVGNKQDGVLISTGAAGGGATGNDVQGNFIGTGLTGNALGNGRDGVRINAASINIIGGPGIGTTNTIANNGGAGVSVLDPSSHADQIIKNSIYSNGGLGIDLGDDGVTPNGSDPRTGPNNLPNFPVGLTAQQNGNNLIVTGILSSTDPTAYTIDIYANQKVDNFTLGNAHEHFGEGEHWLASIPVSTTGVFSKSIPGPLVFDGKPYPFLSATATGNASLSTSEFSPVYSDMGRADGIVDSDGDGLPDEWETYGVDYNGDGQVDLNLPAMGADPNRPDLFVESDYFPKDQPDPLALSDVVNAFDNQGINLHIDVDDALSGSANICFISGCQAGATNFKDIEMGNDGSGNPVPCGTGPNVGHLGTSADRTSPNCINILGARLLIERYMIFADNHLEDPGSSGASEAGGPNFMVSLGGVPASNIAHGGGLRVVEGGSFMHELGHSLGLCHGGPMPPGVFTCPIADPSQSYSLDCKPNYLSVMNYLFQAQSAVKRPLDYSEQTLPDLDEETGLNEALGVSQLVSLISRQTVFSVVKSTDSGLTSTPVITYAYGPIDWNLNGSAADTGVTATLDYFPSIN